MTAVQMLAVNEIWRFPSVGGLSGTKIANFSSKLPTESDQHRTASVSICPGSSSPLAFSKWNGPHVADGFRMLLDL